jgi:hypothetical protein
MDSHVHAAPSPDGAVTMEERLVVAAALGLDFHIATDHEHIGDYRPLLQPLGLAGRLASVPGNEMSSLLRGHMNLLPLEPDPELPNGGAFLWYEREFASTCDEFAQIRDWHPDALLQANHPKSGLASAAGWTPGHIAHPESWCEDFDLVEVANGGRVSAEDFYLDLVRRGLLVAPTSASDSHSHLGGSFGMARSLVHCGTTTALDCDADLLSTALRERRTIASVGPFLDTSLEPGALLVGPQRLDVEVLAPSWILVDTLSLLRDGEVVEVVAGTSASFDLDPGVDAVYHVKATGSSGMWPVVGHAPWALSSGFFLDAEGDGWTPPLPALLIAD